MSVRVGVVWNPAKGEKEDLEQALSEVEAGEVSWFETTEEDPGGGATRQALSSGVEVVIAAGGDGTVRAVAEQLAESGADVVLGIVPRGTGNLLARNLGVPLDDVPAAIARALEGESQRIDVGWADAVIDGEQVRRAFLVMAGFGIDAHMITETDAELKDKAGWLAYVESLGRAVSASEVIGIRATFDHGDAEEEKVHTLIVGNCGTIQAGVTLLPDAVPDDGELDVLLLRADGVAGWLDTMRNVLWDNGVRRLLGGSTQAESSDTASHRRTKELVIDLSVPRVFEVDGDDLGEATKIAISLQPGAILVR